VDLVRRDPEGPLQSEVKAKSSDMSTEKNELLFSDDEETRDSAFAQPT